jgi:HD superfamily phosphohydrolase
VTDDLVESERPSFIRRIADPVHTSIGLTDLECRIIDTRAFQRLRRVKHLGLASYVFPGADFSRFAHSLGVCHVTGKLLDALKFDFANATLAREWQKYRLAGLLHDIGHYPMSHALEGPIRDVYGSQIVGSAFEDEKPEPVGWLRHEEVGRLVLEEDSELKRVLAESRWAFKPEEISDVFNRSLRQDFAAVGSADSMANLVSSDLDADRIDYLQRSAHHTGLPYGSVDIDYLISQITFDREGRVCLYDRALKTADHFLLCRYFDTQQVAFHKTVAGFELILKDAVKELLKAQVFELHAENLRAMIKSGEWARIDDQWLDDQLQRAYESTDISDKTKQKIAGVLFRRPPKLIWAHEELVPVHGEGRNALSVHNLAKQKAEELRGRVAARFELDADWFCIWDQDPFRITRIDPRSGEALIDETQFDLNELAKARDKQTQIIRIMRQGKPDGELIDKLPSSLMSILSQYALSAVRMYVIDSEKTTPSVSKMRTYLID